MGLFFKITRDMEDKVGCVFSMVIRSDFCMGQYRDDDHQEDAPNFNS